MFKRKLFWPCSDHAIVDAYTWEKNVLQGHYKNGLLILIEEDNYHLYQTTASVRAGFSSCEVQIQAVFCEGHRVKFWRNMVELDKHLVQKKTFRLNCTNNFAAKCKRKQKCWVWQLSVINISTKLYLTRTNINADVLYSTNVNINVYHHIRIV